MQKKILIARIKEDYEQQVIADDLFTQALEALENSNWIEARKRALLCLQYSDSIEQRLGIHFILDLIDLRDPALIKNILDQIYDY